MSLCAAEMIIAELSIKNIDFFSYFAPPPPNLSKIAKEAKVGYLDEMPL